MDERGDDPIRLKAERDLYRRLLELGHETAPHSFLREALALIVEVADAKQGYLELYEDTSGEPRWWMAHGFNHEQVNEVRSKLSGGIIARAVASGETLVTPSAMLDPRFSGFDSVRLGKIEAVLCTPVGSDPARGVLYLQGRERPGLFSEGERRHAQIFAQHVGALAQRLLDDLRRSEAGDPTAPLRDKLRVPNVIGHSPALAAVLKEISLVAPRDVYVLLRGSCGTGKTQLARVIHDNSPRAHAPFVELNCAALPESLVESELFGALPGAFTGATRKIEGKVAAAEGGTLFLDEVGELSPTTQAKLLQLLESKIYYPLAASKPLTADVRVIAATNDDLELAVSEKRFREDLYFRLRVLEVRAPDLAERRADIPDLAAHFCTLATERFNLPRLRFSPAALRAAEASAWPGNIRELLNAVEVATIRAAGEGCEEIEVRHLFPDRAAVDGSEVTQTFQEMTRHFQSQLLAETLQEHDWNIVEVAKRLDLARSHVYNLIKAFGLKRA